MIIHRTYRIRPRDYQWSDWDQFLQFIGERETTYLYRCNLPHLMDFLGECLPIFGIQDIVIEEKFQVLMQGLGYIEEHHEGESHDQRVFLGLSIETSLIQAKSSVRLAVVILEPVQGFLDN